MLGNNLVSNMINQKSHEKDLLVGAMNAFFLKLGAAGLTFFMHVVVARTLGANGSGIFFLAFTIVAIAATVGRFGLDNAIVKFVASNAVSSDWQKINSVFSISEKYVFCLSLLISTIIYTGAEWFALHVFDKIDLTGPLRLLSLAIIPIALFTYYANALRGLMLIRHSIFVLSVLSPIVFLVLCWPLMSLYGISGAAGAYLFSVIVASLAGKFIWINKTKRFSCAQKKFDKSALLASCVPLFIISLLQLIMTWASTLILGGWVESSDVGIFNAANRTSMLVSFILIAVNSIAAPKFAELYRRQDFTALRIIAKKSTLLMILLAFPVVMMFVAEPMVVMHFFGSEFVDGAQILRILAIGQFVNVATGSVGVILMMCGREREYKHATVIASILNLCLNFILIPICGVLGAATATSISIAIQNFIGLFYVTKLFDSEATR